MTFVWWHWLALGLLLIGAEFLVSGYVLLWFGVGALLVGLLLAAAPDLSLSWQIITFATTAILALAASQIWLQRFGGREEAASLNRPDDGLPGRVFRLEDPIEHGIGQLWIGDVHWRIAGPDLPAGKEVRILRWDNAAAALTVEPVDKDNATQAAAGNSGTGT